MPNLKRTSIAVSTLIATIAIGCFPAVAAKVKPKNHFSGKRSPVNLSKSIPVNAYNVFLAAAALNVDQQKVGYALAREHGSGDSLDREYTLDEKSQLVQENTKALAKLREGFAFPYHNPPIRSFAAVALYYKDFRALARLLALEADVAREKHDTKTAINSSLDAIQLGEMIQRDSPILGMLVGVACQAIGRRPLQAMVIGSGFQVDGAKEGAHRLSRILTTHVPYSDILKVEKQTDLASLDELYTHPSIAVKAAQLAGTGEGAGDQQQTASQLFSLLLQVDKDQVVTSYSNQMDSLIERYGQSYDNTLVPISPRSDPLMLSKYKLLYECRFKDVASELASRCLMTLLALQAYNEDHKAYPSNLQALSPEYLPHVPGDPFAHDAPLRYAPIGPDANSFSLYSVGPDGQDDNGNPAINQFAKTESAKTIIFPDSRGDFNAIINHY